MAKVAKTTKKRKGGVGSEEQKVRKVVDKRSKTQIALAQATRLIREYAAKQQEVDNLTDLIDEQKTTYYLQFTLSKAPVDSDVKATYISLPHTPRNLETAEVCLITRTPQRKWKDKCAEEKEELPFIKRVIELRKLVKKFPTPRDKRSLLNSFDVFLVDKCIVHLVPGKLGQHFRRSTKMPAPVPLSEDMPMAPAIKEQLQKVQILLRTGGSVSIRVGDESLTEDQISENSMVAIQKLQERLNKRFGQDEVSGKPACRILSVVLRKTNGVSIPIPLEE